MSFPTAQGPCHSDSDSDELPIIAFAGYPSAGKSTIINSINGKFVLDVGVDRTTLQPQLVGPSDIFHWANPDPNINAFYHANPVSDDKVPFTMLDLPGISDAENRGAEERGEERNFDDVTDAYVLMSHVVCWVSAMPDAFQRQYEVDDFKRLRKLVLQQQESTGAFIQMCIVLSKYNQYDHDIKSDGRKSDGPPERNKDGEIIRKGEQSSAQDCYERVRKLFPEVLIMKYNAFGRILHRDNISAALIQQVKDKGESANNINTCFNLRWCVDQKALRKQAHLLHCLLGTHLPPFVSGVQSLSGQDKPTGGGNVASAKTATDILGGLRSQLPMPTPVPSTRPFIPSGFKLSFVADSVVSEYSKEFSFESEHPYKNDDESHFNLNFPGASRVEITFDERSKTEETHDYVQFQRSTGQPASEKYSGKRWPGVGGMKSLSIPILANDLKGVFRSNARINDWGKFHNIQHVTFTRVTRHLLHNCISHYLILTPHHQALNVLSKFFTRDHHQCNVPSGVCRSVLTVSIILGYLNTFGSFWSYLKV
jgi:GTP-binding protein EngB required for normal cell division